jgi:hypothetical protein
MRKRPSSGLESLPYLDRSLLEFLDLRQLFERNVQHSFLCLGLPLYDFRESLADAICIARPVVLSVIAAFPQTDGSVWEA